MQLSTTESVEHGGGGVTRAQFDDKCSHIYAKFRSKVDDVIRTSQATLAKKPSRVLVDAKLALASPEKKRTQYLESIKVRETCVGVGGGDLYPLHISLN
jgi:hypothetical protein